MKPIEAGCMARVVNTGIEGTDGTIVEVGDFIGYVRRYSKKNDLLWELKTPLSNPQGVLFYDIPDKYLERIYDPDIQEEIESELVMVE